MDKQITVTIDTSMQGRTILHILEKRLGFSKGLIKKLKTDEEAVLLNGEKAKLLEKVNIGDEITVTIGHKKSDIIPIDIPLEILYEDEDIIAVNKPRSMPTHPSRDHSIDTLANGIVHYLKNTTFHAITRLDRDTSGVVLIAKNAFAAQRLSDDMKTGLIHKEYTAVLQGVPEPREGTISAPIKRQDCGIRRFVDAGGKEAITHYRVLKEANGLSYVCLNPVTGRTHQLRVHMSHVGTPIYGDWLYGQATDNEKTRLHCSKVTFIHPGTKEKMTVIASEPQDMLILCNLREIC